MKTLTNLLVLVGLLFVIAAAAWKVLTKGLLPLDISPLASLVIGNTCLLLALVSNNLKK